jgi:hypothetical protein
VPLEVTDFDIQMSDSVIGVGLQAKRSMLIERWPDYASQIELWTAETRGGGEPELLRLAAELRLLLATLGEHRRYGAQSQSQVPPAGLPRVRAVGAPAAGR